MSIHLAAAQRCIGWIVQPAAHSFAAQSTAAGACLTVSSPAGIATLSRSIGAHIACATYSKAQACGYIDPSYCIAAITTIAAIAPRAAPARAGDGRAAYDRIIHNGDIAQHHIIAESQPASAGISADGQSALSCAAIAAASANSTISRLGLGNIGA